jgi:hypothetical protein
MKLGSKYSFAVAIMLFVFTGMVLAQKSNPTITKVEASVGYITVEWSMSSDDGVGSYIIWRKNGSSDFIEVGTAYGGNSRSFKDDNGLLKSSSQYYFFYKVQALGYNGQVLGESPSNGEKGGLIYNITSYTAKRTWGSIKAMFR